MNEHVSELAAFVENASFERLSRQAVDQLKLRIIDALGCAVGALQGEPVRAVREHIEELGGNPLCSLIGGGRSAPDRAAFFNGTLVRYLDFNDSYLAKGETCHPSDNLGAVLAAAEYARAGGREFLTALAVAYQVQCRLSDVAPVRHRGFDHTTQGAYAAAAGVAKALGLNRTQTAHAIAISGTANNALRVTRTGSLSHWKGLAYPNTAGAATHAAFLAKQGITGPLAVFEGNKGFMETIAGKFTLDWSRENLERVAKTIVKKYNAEIHSQSAIEAAMELKRSHGFAADQIERLDLRIFDVAWHIIGGGEEGAKMEVHTKEEADHSLPFLVAVALVDEEVTPRQYLPESIRREEVHALMRRIHVIADEALSGRFPEEMPCAMQIRLVDGKQFETEKRDYEGFHTRPASWTTARTKFDALAEAHTESAWREDLFQTVRSLEKIPVAEFARRLREMPIQH